LGHPFPLSDSSATAARAPKLAGHLGPFPLLENQKPDVVELTGVGFLVCHGRWAAPASGFFHHRVCESTKVKGGS
jgi:hypothetical protein